MNRNKLKAYAPQARRDFIKAVTDRAAYCGLTENKIEPITEQGDVAIIAGKAFPRTVTAKRNRLEERIRRQGFEQVIEAMAYIWFNRLVAIRFMELHGYLGHGYWVLSHPEGSTTPEIVEHAEHVDLLGLDRERVIELKLEGTKEAELYRLLLIAQCNALHKAIPLLFERIDDETELLLPENLLHSDSVVRKLVNEIPEDDWQEVEIIGWLYQFYISEKKDEVIGKVVKSEDIPAATQLFTPNWIVKYMVQNTLGQQWMATYPNSPRKQQMEFYIEPAEQSPEVHDQLRAITPKSLNPEELTLLDPACGSGHILVEAYDLLKAIYQERGYRKKDIPRLILEKNLYGLEIDDRAAQLAAFTLMMKSRADDRRIFEYGTKPHVLAIQESKGLDAGEITEALNAPILKTELPPREFLFEQMEDARTPLFSRKNLSEKGDIDQADVVKLIDLFEHSKTFGSLIRVPNELAKKLPILAERIEAVLAHGEMFGQAAARSFKPLVEQARLLEKKYDAVVTNPPYMGSRFFNKHLKSVVHKQYPNGKGDLYAAFILRNMVFAKDTARIAMITIPNWMFISSFEDLREDLLGSCDFESFSFNGRGVWGSDFGSCHFAIRKSLTRDFVGKYLKLFEKAGSVSTEKELKQRIKETTPHLVSATELATVPGKPLSFWISPKIRECFHLGKPLEKIANPKQGMATANNDYFVHYWWEVSSHLIKFDATSKKDFFDSGCKWAPYNKGGPFQKWCGNNESVLRFDEESYKILKTVGNHCPSENYYFRESVTWGLITVSLFSCRYCPNGFVFDVGGSSAFPDSTDILFCLGFLNSKLNETLIKALNPTVNTQVGDLKKLPIYFGDNVQRKRINAVVEEALHLARHDWNDSETSWDFQQLEFLASPMNKDSIKTAWKVRKDRCNLDLTRMKTLEEDNNRAFIQIYELDQDLSPEVPEDQITLCRPDREEDIKRTISYAIGCMMGRYSLDKQGLIYAYNGNQGFDPSRYKIFPADQDGIIPVTETAWFDDDAANRLVEFIVKIWPKEHLEQNLKFVADSLGPKRGESPRETIRRYLATGFYKHHLAMYKKRPIYWLFSSGKHRGFQCLVYLHRYNEGTLSRIRTEYLIPLEGKISARIEQLAGDIAAATSTAHRKKLEEERDKLIKQQAELQTFDEKLRHYADQRISLDLDDGVKVNYGKFGELLAEVKAVTGKRPN